MAKFRYRVTGEIPLRKVDDIVSVNRNTVIVDTPDDLSAMKGWKICGMEDNYGLKFDKTTDVPFIPEDVYHKLCNKNPNLKKLKDEFGLEYT